MGIEERFKFHGMDEDQTKQVVTIRERAIEFAKDIEVLCPDGREKSLALTKLEETAMWSIKSITQYVKRISA